MARLQFGDPLTSRVTTLGWLGSPVLSLGGTTVTLYSDAAGTALADISLTSGGTSLAGSLLPVTPETSRLPATWYGPSDGTDTLYWRPTGAPSSVPTVQITASLSTRVKALEVGEVGENNGAQIAGDLGGTLATPQVVGTHLAAPLPIAQGGTASATQSFVDLTAAQSVAGVKTFTSSPVVPTPTTSAQATTKAYVDASIGPARALRTVTTPPVSTTVYTNGTGTNLLLSLSYTLSPSVSVPADVLAEISPDGTTWTTWADPSLPIGASTDSGAVGQLIVTVPSGWRFRFTATNATLGALIAIG